MTRKISIQEALREIKLTEKKLNSNKDATPLIAVKSKDKTVVGESTSEEAFVAKVTETYQSTKALLSNYHMLKGKVAESNAVNFVTVAGKRMTVSAAIEYKTSLAFELGLLSKMRHEYASAVRLISNNENVLQREAEANANAYFSSQTDKNGADYNDFITKYKEARVSKIVDPLNIEKEIKELADFIEEFTAEVDNVLTLHNVNTLIEVD